MSLLNKLTATKNKGQRRVGRGYGSQKGGHTSGRGTKGQLSREGGKRPLWFEGGQLPLVRRLPWWRGKGRLQSLKVQQEVQLRQVLAHQLTEVTPESLVQAGLVDNVKDKIRLIGACPVETKITVTGVSSSQPVRQAIEKAGGQVK